MDKPAKAAEPAARKRTPAATKTTPRPRRTAPTPAAVDVEIGVEAEVVESIPAPLPVAPVKSSRHHLRAIAAFGLVLTAVAAAALLVGRSSDGSAQDSGAPVTVSAEELSSFAGSQAAPVYWVGPLRARTLELTRTDAGTFVRYLPAGSPVGGSSRALTIATYPLPDAYGTAARRAKGAGMSSSRTLSGGLAVWSKAQPTSVYVAFRGVPSLVEVYAPQAQEVRALALSRQLRPVG